MRNTKIILVEGMPGTGKSTVSQFIHLWLQANGLPVFWCHEESSSYPVCLFFDRHRHRSWSEFCDEAESLWRKFAEELQSQNQIAVLDAAVLQNHIRSMLIFDCDRSLMLSLVHRIENILRPLDPTWIYLKPKDIERNFRDVVEVRGQLMLDLWLKAQQSFPYAKNAPEGFHGFIAFWKDFGEIADRAFDELTISKLKLNVSNDDWDDRFRELLAFLELPRASNSAAPESLERYTGKYILCQDQTVIDSDRAVGKLPAKEFALEMKHGCLTATVEQPTIDVEQGPIGCFQEVRLIPSERNRFSVAAWPHMIEFAEDGNAKITGLRLSVSATGWNDSEAVYIRQ